MPASRAMIEAIIQGEDDPERLADLSQGLVQVAWVAARMRNTYLRGQFLRLESRRGPKKAILAVAAS